MEARCHVHATDIYAVMLGCLLCLLLGLFISERVGVFTYD